MKSFKFILVAVTVLGLVACGKSKAIVALDEIIGTYNSELTACESAEKEGMAQCLADATTRANKGWTENVIEAGDDLEELARVSAEYAAATQKYTDLASKG